MYDFDQVPLMHYRILYKYEQKQSHEYEYYFILNLMLNLNQSPNYLHMPLFPA